MRVRVRACVRVCMRACVHVRACVCMCVRACACVGGEAEFAEQSTVSFFRMNTLLPNHSWLLELSGLFPRVVVVVGMRGGVWGCN